MWTNSLENISGPTTESHRKGINFVDIAEARKLIEALKADIAPSDVLYDWVKNHEVTIETLKTIVKTAMLLVQKRLIVYEQIFEKEERNYLCKLNNRLLGLNSMIKSIEEED